MRHLFLFFFVLSVSPGLAQQSTNPWLRTYLNNSEQSSEKLSLFVKGEKAAIEQFVKENNGILKGSVSGYYALSIPAHAIQKLINTEGISHVDFNLYEPHLLNDTMRTSNRVNDVHNAITPLTYPVTGKGVIVGIIDDGCELDHDDFKNPDGTTRILKIWDHSQSFDPLLTPPDFGYGREYDSAMINAGTAVHNNPQGHGTTVTGSAVGNGLATGTHKGVAPDANIVIVKSSFGIPNWTSTIADAVDYIYRVADAEGMPCVLNLSLGSYLGSHDAFDPAALYIDSLISAKRGRLLVCAAGNSGHMPAYHLGYDITADTTFTWFKINSTNSPLGVPGVLLEIWADTADFNQVHFAVGADKTSPTYEFRGSTSFHQIHPTIGNAVLDSIMNNGNKLADVEFYSELRGEQYVFYIVVENPDSAQYDFRLSFTGTGKFDTWSAQWLRLNDMVTALPSVVDFPDIVHYQLPDTMQSIVSSWACSPKVVTTANYNNAYGYIDMVGDLQIFNQPKGTRATTSSRGPARTGHQKPDIAASGNGTMSACPVNLQTFYAANDPSLLAWGGKHIRNGGTSMASPVVAGTGALLLERCPELDADNFHTIITSTAFNDQHTGINLPNVLWGSGKIDVFAAVTSSLNTPTPSVFPEYCENDSLVFSFNGNYLEYHWGNGSQTNTLIFNQPGSSWFYGIDERGCLSDTLHFIVTELPLPIVPTIYYQNDSLFSSIIENGYQWYFNGMILGNATDDFFANPPLGNYVLEVIGSNGCSSFSAPFVVTRLGEFSDRNISVYPNPFEQSFHISGLYPDDFIQVYDNLGRMVPVNISNAPGETTVSFVDNLPGMYFLTVITNNSSITLKLMSR